MKLKKENKIIYLVFAALILGMLFVPSRQISLILFLALAVLFYYFFLLKRSKDKTLVCGKCGHEMPLNTLQYMSTFHEGDSYYRTCTKCGYKEAHLKKEEPSQST